MLPNNGASPVGVNWVVEANGNNAVLDFKFKPFEREGVLRGAEPLARSDSASEAIFCVHKKLISGSFVCSSLASPIQQSRSPPCETSNRCQNNTFCDILECTRRLRDELRNNPTLLS